MIDFFPVIMSTEVDRKQPSDNGIFHCSSVELHQQILSKIELPTRRTTQRSFQIRNTIGKRVTAKRDAKECTIRENSRIAVRWVTILDKRLCSTNASTFTDVYNRASCEFSTESWLIHRTCSGSFLTVVTYTLILRGRYISTRSRRHTSGKD